VVFAETSFPKGPIRNGYEVVFGEASVDLTGAAAEKVKGPVTVNVVFGSSVVKVDPKQAIRITAHTAFGHVSLPDGGTAAVGSSSWESKSAKDKEEVLEVKLSAVFGNIEVRTE